MTQQNPNAPTGAQIAHTNGLTFTIVPADSFTARLARDVRQLAMADGTDRDQLAPGRAHTAEAVSR